MLVGHFAIGLTAKRVEPKISIGTLVLAAMLADFLWCVFMLAGIEHVQFKPGRGQQTISWPPTLPGAIAC